MMARAAQASASSKPYCCNMNLSPESKSGRGRRASIANLAARRKSAAYRGTGGLIWPVKTGGCKRVVAAGQAHSGPSPGRTSEVLCRLSREQTCHYNSHVHLGRHTHAESP